MNQVILAGKASIQDMLNGTLKNQLNDKITLDKLANLIIEEVGLQT